MSIFRKKQPKKNIIIPEKIKILQTFIDKGNESLMQDEFLISDVFKNNRLILVADGIKEKPKSEFASKQVIDVFKNFFVQIDNFDNPATFLHRTGLVATTMLMNKAMTEPDFKEIATSLAGFLIAKDEYYTINVGNCRVYHFSENKLIQKTIDQTQLQKAIDEKIFTETEARKHLENNEVLHYLSASVSDFNIQIEGPFSLKNNDILFASTGGLHYSLSNNEIQDFIIKNHKTNNLAENLGIYSNSINKNKSTTICLYKHLTNTL